MLARHSERTSQAVVVAFPCANEHPRGTLLAVAQRLAALRHEADGGLYDSSRAYGGPLYFVPGCALTPAQAQAFGIRAARDLFGAVVPHAFVATRAIVHPLATPVAPAPAGWNPAFAAQVRDTVLKGNTAFTPADARTAGRRLLAAGPVRIKVADGEGGRGPSVVRDQAALERLLAGLDPEEIERGVVIEEELHDAQTWRVGQASVGPLTASHVGVRNAEGESASGGCQLMAVRGGFDALLEAQPSAQLRLVVARARQFDAAIRSCFPGFFASRTSYELLCGHDAAGRPRCGVLKPCWRVDDATAAEVAALERLAA